MELKQPTFHKPLSRASLLFCLFDESKKKELNNKEESTTNQYTTIKE